MITLIVACAPSSDGRLVIGKDNNLPWSLPEDLRRFRQRTAGHTIVMGRKTFESLKVRPLPDRDTIVLTRDYSWVPTLNLGLRNLALPSLSIVHDPRDIVSRFLLSWQKVFICGGAEIYEEFLPWCNEIDMTLINQSMEGDTYFPWTMKHIEEKFISQFVEQHDKKVLPEEWNGATVLQWRHMIYGKRYVPRLEVNNASAG